MNNLRVSGLIIFLCGLLHLSVTAQQRILGNWELVYVAPTYMEDTDPRGITNVRLHFKSNGIFYNIWPGETLTNSTDSVNYIFADNKLTIIPAVNEPININISFPDSNTMIFNSESFSKRIFKRLTNLDAVTKIIEPKSLQLVNTGVQTEEKEFEYDNSDYSTVQLNERLTGTWEIIGFEDVPNGEMPPYGFFNDIWTFNNKVVNIFQRATQENTNMNYVITTNNEIIVTAPDSSILLWKCSFNQWGNMILDSGNGIARLKLITKNTIDKLTIPLKVVLLKLSGEE